MCPPGRPLLPTAGGRVTLDVGCGTGRFARRLVAHGYRVDAVDPDPATPALAEAAGGGPRYRVADAARAELPPGHYARLLPGSEVRQLLFWRYLLSYTADTAESR
ncbi:class I SAM-dependent methyltransferase [Streptomyces sp. NPDC102360]|uniref:class I SAM-dependent methyltransferase n=1 Tax=Streptomyces sp. NPDC102360 TaxID=3366160 RepID=UPI00382D890F